MSAEDPKDPNDGNPDLAGITARVKRTEEATHIPSHGVGRIFPPMKPGTTLNPSGRPKGMKEIRSLARKKSLDALTALIGVYTLPNGKLDRQADGRVVVAAASTVLKWAYGEPPPYDPNAEKTDFKIDPESLARMPLQERRMLLATLGKLGTVAADSVEDDGPDFDASRFADEPLTIEAAPEKPSHEMAPAPAKPRIKPGPKPKRGRPKKV